MAHIFHDPITGEDRIAQDWQMALKSGDFYMIAAGRVALVSGGTVEVYRGLPVIYGQILDNEGLDPGYWWVRAYSLNCVDGEMGTFCCVEASARLSQPEFEAARARGWRPGPVESVDHERRTGADRGHI